MEKPILFNTPMTQAIREGRKTATRRIVKPNTSWGLELLGGQDTRLTSDDVELICDPPCAVGDVLWVRETWQFWPCITCGERDCTRKPAVYEDAEAITEGCWIYRADGETTALSSLSGGICWRPAIHMPKQAARSFLKVKSVYPAKLQESFLYRPSPVREFAGEGLKFSETCLHCQGVHYATPCEENNELNCIELLLIKSEFERLWDSTVPKGRRDREGWAADPWVWVIRFERCERPDGWPG